MKQKRFTSIILILVIALSMLIVPSKPLTVYAGTYPDSLSTTQREQALKLYKHALDLGFSKECACAIVANADAESDFTNITSGNHLGYFQWDKDKYGTYKGQTHDAGICFIDWCDKNKRERDDITAQFDFEVEVVLPYDLNWAHKDGKQDLHYTVDDYKKVTDVVLATEIWIVAVERCVTSNPDSNGGSLVNTGLITDSYNKEYCGGKYYYQGTKWRTECAKKFLEDKDFGNSKYIGKDTTKTEVKELTSDLLKEKIGSVALYQHQLGYPAGCDGMSMAMVVQNSTLLKEYQLPAGVYNSKENADWKKFKGVAEGVLFQSGGTAIQPNDFLGKYGKSTFNDLKSINITDKHEQGAWKGAFAIDGTSKKKFIEMTHEEFAEVVKQLQAQGYFMILSVRYKKHNTGGWGVYNVSGKSYTDDATYFVPYGGSDYNPNYFTGTDKTLKGNHWTYLLGCASDGKVYINDPATYSDNAQCIALIDKRNGIKYTSGDIIDYVPSYILCFESSDVKTTDLTDGAGVPVNPDAADDAGIDTNDPSNVIQIGDMKFYKETDLTSYNKLDELNISDMYLQDALLENLGQSDVYALDNWKSVADEDKWTVTRVFRLIITLVGILLTVWAIFLYLAYWLDRINNIIDIRFVSFLTLGKMEVSEDELGASYGEVKKERGKVTTINHKAVLKICITTLVLGVLLLTGVLYKFVLGVIQWVSGIFMD